MSSSDSKQETQTTSNVANYDRRVGVDGSGNLVAGEGASVSTTSIYNDISADAIAAAVNAQRDTADMALRAQVASTQAALDANSATSHAAISGVVTVAGQVLDVTDLAIRSNVSATQAALAAGTEAGNRALATVDRTVDLTVTALGDANARAAALASGVVEGNNALTEATRAGNVALVKDFLDKGADALADQRQGADEAILNNAFKYGAYAVTATVLGLGAFLIYAATKHK